MMQEEIIHFTKSNIQISEYNDDLKIYQLKKLENDQLELHYNWNVTFEDNLTVADFMHCLQPFFKKIDTQFIAYTKGFELMHYYTQMNKPNTKKKEKDEIDFMEMYWNAEVSEYENVEDGKTETDYSYYASYHGVSTKEKYNFSFSLTPINEWKHYPFKLNETFTCTFYGKNKKGKMTAKKLFTYTKHFTLYELIRYFVYELTYMGYTDDIIDKGHRFEQQVNEIKNQNFKSFSIDDMMIESYENDLQKAIEEERFEAAQRLQNKINELRSERE
jgi:UvrB/uvrC motif